MKRRKALQHLGLGITGGLFLPGSLSRCSPADPGPEINYAGTVAVIGAGPAGLYVADILRSKGVKVVVYEAGDQVGGRVRSLRNQSSATYPVIPSLSSDFPLELGADRFIGTDSILGKVCQAYRLPTTEINPSLSHFVLDNIPKLGSGANSWDGDPDFEAAMTFRQNLENLAGSNQTVQQAVAAAGIAPRAHGMLNGQIGNMYGADNNSAGVGGLGEQETLRVGDGKVLVLTGNPLQELLISRFNQVLPSVKLNTPISAIQYDSDPITLTAADGSTYEADKVIVTVPVSVLKNGDLSFSPALGGARASSLSKIDMGASFRAIIEFKRNFWGEDSSLILGAENLPEFVNNGLGRGVFNSTLQITVNGSKAEMYSALGDTAIDALLAELDTLYAGQATQYVRRVTAPDPNDPDQIIELGPIYVTEDWTNRPYILGGYSYPLPGSTNEDRLNIGAPLNGKLFFAGEATDITGNAGLVNGALASAERCAEEVVLSITQPS